MSDPERFDDLFAPEPDATPANPADGEPWKVLLVDDEPDIHAVLHLALQDVVVEGRPLRLLDAHSAEEARTVLAEHPEIALVLLDVVMESEQAGLVLVHHIRQVLGNHAIQIVLVTGQPGYAPERRVVMEYEIDGYRLKSELTADKIFVSVYAALRTHRAMTELETHHRLLERWRNVFEHAEWGVAVSSADGETVEMCNPAFARLHGYADPQEVAGRPVAEMYAPGEHPVLAEHFRQIHEQGHYTFECLRRRKDGSSFPALIDATAVKDAQGGFLYRIVNVQDITERRQIEAELADHQLRLEALVAQRTDELNSLFLAVPDLYFRMDEAGTILDFRAGQTLDLYVQPEQFLGKRMQEVLPPSIGQEFADAIQGVLAGIPMATIEYELPVGGEERAFEARLLPLQARQVAVVVRNINERKRHERELLGAKQAAETANRAKSIFLATMSHELRTPLNAILGFAQILEHDKRIPTDERTNIATINRSGNHLLALINEVLEISRIEAGRMEVSRESFDLGALICAVDEMIRLRANAKGLAFKVEFHGEIAPYVMGDALHLRRVLINLLGNAVKFTDHGDVALHLYPEQDRIRFLVSDTGPGIVPEEQKRVFQAFYQTQVGVTQGEGTGLGLTICVELVRLMGGELTLESTPGQGSHFGFTIPLPPTDAAPYVANNAGIRRLAPGQPTPRILVAEDHPDNQAVIEQMLGRVGCEVRIAADGRAVVEAFRTWRPQLILMDMHMPVMDGYGATRAIRALPEGASVPIVALTASAFEEDRSRVLAAGCDEMLRKPVEEGRLLDVIARLLGLIFEYERADVAAESEPSADLARLPPHRCRELSDAAERLDAEAVAAIVERLRPDHAAEAELITRLAEEFRFDRLIELCAAVTTR